MRQPCFQAGDSAAVLQPDQLQVIFPLLRDLRVGRVSSAAHNKLLNTRRWTVCGAPGGRLLKEYPKGYGNHFG